MAEAHLYQNNHRGIKSDFPEYMGAGERVRGSPAKAGPLSKRDEGPRGCQRKGSVRGGSSIQPWEGSSNDLSSLAWSGKGVEKCLDCAPCPQYVAVT